MVTRLAEDDLRALRPLQFGGANVVKMQYREITAALVAAARRRIASQMGATGMRKSNSAEQRASSDALATYSAVLKAPFAMLGIRTTPGAVTGIDYLPEDTPELAPSDAIAKRACSQIEYYLDDPYFRFSLPLAPAGTAFRRRVWDSLLKIPIGESRTYGEIARWLSTAPRAVGGACGANPIALVIPCHRVVGSLGSLGGFMGVTAGSPIGIKRWLLKHEGYRFGE